MAETLTGLLERIDAATQDPPVTVGDILSEMGNQSFAPIILVIALLMVSPLSGIPGAPTVSACLIVTIAIQALIGRKHLWLPQFLLRRSVPEARLRAAAGWLQRPAAWFDRHSRRRWSWLTLPPIRWATMATCAVLPLTWPVLELLPFVTSLGASAISLLAFGLVTRDGLYLLLGYAVIAGLVVTALGVLGGV